MPPPSAREKSMTEHEFNAKKTLCFSGPRREKLLKTVKDMAELRVNRIYRQIKKATDEGYDTFLFSACYGFDLVCAESVLLQKEILRGSSKRIRLFAVIPYEAQADKWSRMDKERYFDILDECDDKIVLNKNYISGCYQQCGRFIIDNSSRLVCYYDGSKTSYMVNYAKKKDLSIVNLFEA